MSAGADSPPKRLGVPAPGVDAGKVVVPPPKPPGVEKAVEENRFPEAGCPKRPARILVQ